MPEYRCGAGHVSSMVFAADQLKQPCPVCEITVYKFVALVNPDDAIEDSVAEEPAGLSTTAKNRRNAIIFVISAVVIFVAALGVKRQQFAPVAPASAPVLPVSSAVIAKPAPNRNNISEVRIQELKAAMQDDGVLRSSFVLINDGGASNDYPSLLVRWKGSSEPVMKIDSHSYPHPPSPFTRVDVVTELKAPADATGIDITLQYD